MSGQQQTVIAICSANDLNGTKGSGREYHRLSLSARHVSELPEPDIPSCTAIDAHYLWQATPSLEISLSLQNLFDPGHLEFGEFERASEYQRGGFLKVVWQG